MKLLVICILSLLWGVGAFTENRENSAIDDEIESLEYTSVEDNTEIQGPIDPFVVPVLEPTNFGTEADEPEIVTEWFNIPSTGSGLDETIPNNEYYPDMIPMEEDLFLDVAAQFITDENWSADDFNSTLRIQYTPYSALLYLEDEFGLEFLCAGYWLKNNLLLIRGDCFPSDEALNIEETVVEAFPNYELNLLILRLASNSVESAEKVLHLANVRSTFPLSLNQCSIYVLREDDILFEMLSWGTRPLPFKRANGFCREGYICLRTRSSTSRGSDYALICDRSLTGMLTSDRTKIERAFGMLTLMDLSIAKSWIDEILLGVIADEQNYYEADLF